MRKGMLTVRKTVDKDMIKELENERDNHLFQADQASEFAQAGETIADVVNWVKDSIRETRKAWKCDLEMGRMHLG